MRLWSVHPKYLDSKGLVALWREGLLAQKVLAGKTKGYGFHPQLDRFRAAKDPLACIGSYLNEVAEEASRRKYSFDRTKILKCPRKIRLLAVTRGQLAFETEHLLRKLKLRDPVKFKSLATRKLLAPHPSFQKVPGGVEPWEKG